MSLAHPAFWGAKRAEALSWAKRRNDKRRRFFADAQNDLFCHPEAKPKGLLWRFFAFGSEWQERGQMLSWAKRRDDK